MRLRNALLAASLFLPVALGAGAASAQQRDAEQVIRVPPGAVVLILPPGSHAVTPGAVQLTPADFPLMRVMAEQEAMMRRMMAGMDGLFLPLPAPDTLIRRVMNDFDALGAGPGLMPVGGHGVCSRSVTYVDPGNGQPPRVNVTQSGDACGSSGTSAVQPMTQSLTPAQPRPQPRLYDIGYPPRPAAVHPPRT